MKTQLPNTALDHRRKLLRLPRKEHPSPIDPILVEEMRILNAIRNKYGSLREWKQQAFFGMATLKNRGWNKALVEKHLGKHDETTSGAYRAADLWDKKRVFAAEKLPEVKASLKLTLKRSEKIMEARCDTETLIDAEVAAWDVRLITKAEAKRHILVYRKKYPTMYKNTSSASKHDIWWEIMNTAQRVLKPQLESAISNRPTFKNYYEGQLHNLIFKKLKHKYPEL